jgi:hypothetical protein
MSKRTSRANSKELKIIKQYLLKRDGSQCSICKRELANNKLFVEHKDNNHLNWEAENLQLACQKCNISKNPPYSNKTNVDYVCVSVCDEPKPQSYEMYKNMRSEPLFRKWLNKEMTRKLRMRLDDVVDSGAEYSEVSVETVRNRYLKKLTSRLGPYRVIEENGEKIIEWKSNFFPFNNG